MTTYRGQDGFVSLGGYVLGALRVWTAAAAGATTVELGASALSGVVVPGDRFTVAGVAGTYTVTHTALAAQNRLTVLFTPAAPAGGFPGAAAVLFAWNTVAQTRQWTVTPSLQVLETTVQGDVARTRRTGLVEWEGSFEALFDYDDPAQQALVDRYSQDQGMGGKPSGLVVGLSFTVSEEGPVTIVGAGILQTLAFASPGQELVTVTATFVSTGNEMAVGAPPWWEAVPIGTTAGLVLQVRYLEEFDLGQANLPVQFTETWEPAA